MKSQGLSKLQFIRGLQCHKSLYLHKNRPELRDEVTEAQEAAFESGAAVGVLAQQLFPGGVAIPYEGVVHAEQIEKTKESMDNGAVAIYEASFSHDGIFVKADILHRGVSGWELYEVKSSTDIKDVYYSDIAIQYYVLTGAGVNLSKAAIVHIDNSYTRDGEIEVDKLLKIQELTGPTIEKQEFVIREVERMREMLKSGEPAIDIGPHCADPYPCDFHGHCWRDIPKVSIFSIRGGGGPDKFALYRKGIVRLEDIDIDLLTGSQRIQVESYLNKKIRLDKRAVRRFLDSLWHPLCFLDFETLFMTPVPLFDGTRPYQQVPFQFSLDIIKQEGAELRHHEFLAGHDEENPQEALVNSLIDLIPENGCVLTYNKTFETKILRELAVRFPKQKKRIDRIVKNTRDLIVPFRNKDIYYPEFNGSYSLKAVLPALIPEMRYDALEVQDGEMASNAYLRMRKSGDSAEIASIRKALLEYCRLDTLAMVKILEKMREMAG